MFLNNFEFLLYFKILILEILTMMRGMRFERTHPILALRKFHYSIFFLISAKGLPPQGSAFGQALPPPRKCEDSYLSFLTSSLNSSYLESIMSNAVLRISLLVSCPQDSI
jgi:hypothetical protein